MRGFILRFQKILRFALDDTEGLCTPRLLTSRLHHTMTRSPNSGRDRKASVGFGAGTVAGPWPRA